MTKFSSQGPGLRLRFWVFAWVGALVIVMAAPAHAFVPEGQGWAGAGAANLHHEAPTAAGWWGPVVQAGAVFELSDFWRVGADLSAGHHFAREVDDESLAPRSVVSAGAEIRYTFDVVTYVPYVGLGAAVHPLGPPSETSPDGELATLRATVGLDYRHSREWSFGGAAQLHAPVTQPADFPHYSTLRLHVGYHFRGL